DHRASQQHGRCDQPDADTAPEQTCSLLTHEPPPTAPRARSELATDETPVAHPAVCDGGEVVDRSVGERHVDRTVERSQQADATHLEQEFEHLGRRLDRLYIPLCALFRAA